MQRVIIGTAGHIDHGKTALIRALTGIDADRLPEEKARGITIDLGFAHLEDGDVRIGFVDVPGHERFVRNMLAGAGGIDAVLLVVAADEGVMPQTREHFAIVDLLGIGDGIVAVTKTDRVSPDLLEVVQAELSDFLAGTFLADRPRVPVSAVTGQGVPDLRRELTALARRVQRKEAAGRLRLPVDRAFVAAGFGPVVTGSLISGAASRDQHVEILPERLPARIRRVEVHGRESPEARAGERTSLNLAGIEISRLHRGQMIVAPGSVEPTRRLLARVRLLEGAPALRSGQPVAFHHYASETNARVRPLSGARIAPGGSDLALVTLSASAAASFGDRFVLRRPSPPATIGGGEILDLHPPRRIAAEDREAFDLGSETERRLRRVVREPRGLPLADLAAAEAVREDEALASLGRPIADGDLREIGPNRRLFSTRVLAAIAARARRETEREIARRPGAIGASRAAVLDRAFAGLDPREAEAILKSCAESAGLDLRGDEIRVSGSAGLPAREGRLAEEIADRYDASGLAPPSPGEVARSLAAKEKIVEGLVSYLLRAERLVRLPGGIFLSRRAADAVVDRLRSSGRGRITVPEFKEMFSLTRRIAIPLLEHLDERRVTRRVGDAREILPGPS